MTEIQNASVVVTGASSGIGRATALAFARQGARLTLAARRGEVLEEVAAECRALGGAAVVAPTDVADPEAVAALARTALDAWGRVDVWVSNAGVGAVGRLDEVPPDLHRRIIEVNLIGAVNSAHAAIPLFRRQGGGVFIATVSMAAWSPLPYASAYTASKFGLRGLLACLRQEVAEESGIRVCGVFPSMIDTPGIVHGANLSGRNVDPGFVLYAPERVADAIVATARRPRRAEVPVGFPAGWARFAYGVAPLPFEATVGFFARRIEAQAEPAPRRLGTVMRPGPQGTGSGGGWLNRPGSVEAGRLTSLALAGAGAALALGALAWAGKGRTVRPPRRPA